MRTYREASREDLLPICQLGNDVNAMHHHAWPHVFAGATEPAAHASHWLQSLGAENATTFVCEQGANIIGFVTVCFVQDNSPLLQPVPYARVGTVCVANEHRGSGIGRELMRLAEQWAANRGVSDIRLNVWDFNSRAIKLYAELGYEVRSHVLGKRLPVPDA
jgi:ribosomal protein S18 acetylase RimI-like enzyme